MQISSRAIDSSPVVVSEHQFAGKYLIFYLGKEEFGIEVLKVKEIMGVLDITPVPHLPAHIKGVINLRGKIIPVVDLRLKFGMQSVDYTQRTCIIVVNAAVDGAQTSIGIVVDGVAEVLNISDGDIENTPKFGDGTDTSYMLAMAKIKGQVKLLLNIDKALDTKELSGLTTLTN